MLQFAFAIVTVWLVFKFTGYAMMKGETKSAPEKGSTGTNSNNSSKQKTGSPQKSSSGNAISILCRRMAGSNWDNASEANKKPTATDQDEKPQNKRKKDKPKRSAKWTKFVAMDCEMVGIGPNGQDDMLARVSIVNQNGEVLMDKYVQAQEEVVDYRTKVSGIRPHNMENGEEFEKVQQEVKQMLRDKVLVGHSVKNDLAVLRIKHPYQHIRDTAKYRPLAKLVSNGATPSLKRLAKAILGMDIQGGEHSSVEDARACMQVYVRFSAEWERYLQKLIHHRTHHGRRRS